MEASLTRSQLLRGRWRTQSYLPTPPWSSAQFHNLCTACGKCLSACESNLLVPNEHAIPQANIFASACSLCGECVNACESGALDKSAFANGNNAWNWTAVIGSQCLMTKKISCEICVDGCDTRAIRILFSSKLSPRPVINPDLCVSCGRCTSTCPEKAIYIETKSK